MSAGLSGRIRRPRRRPRRRGHDPDRQPGRVGAGDAGLLAHGGGGAPVQHPARRRDRARAPDRDGRSPRLLDEEPGSSELPEGLASMTTADDRRRARRGPPAGDAGRDRRPRPRGPGADRVHLGDHRRAACARCTRSAIWLAQRTQAEHWLGARDGRARLVHDRERVGEVSAQRLRRAVALRRGRDALSTRGSIPPSASS